MAAEDTADRHQQMASAIAAIVRYEYLRRNEFLPRPKERIRLIAASQPHLAALLEDAQSGRGPGAWQSMRQAAVHVLGTAEFFEWDSGADNSLPPAQRS